MSDYLAYTSGVVRLFATLDDANAWLAEVGGGKMFVAVERLAAAEAREKYLERQCDTYLGERQQIKAAIPAELLKEDLTLAENVAFIVSQLSKENPVNDKDPAVCGLCGLPMPPGEEMFQYHGYSGPCPGPPKIMSVEEINASCDVSGHILLPEGSQCGICGVQTADMVRITRSVWDAIRKQLDDTRDQLVDLRQTHNGILAQIGTGDDPTYDELEQRLAAAEAERDELTSLFELQHTRTNVADAEYVAVHPDPRYAHGYKPDLGTLVEWLRTERDEARQRLDAAEDDAKRYQFVKRQYVQTHSPHMNGTVGFRFSHGWPALSGHSFDEAVDFAMMVVDEAAKGGRDE